MTVFEGITHSDLSSKLFLKSRLGLTTMQYVCIHNNDACTRCDHCFSRVPSVLSSLINRSDASIQRLLSIVTLTHACVVSVGAPIRDANRHLLRYIVTMLAHAVPGVCR